MHLVRNRTVEMYAELLQTPDQFYLRPLLHIAELYKMIIFYLIFGSFLVLCTSR